MHRRFRLTAGRPWLLASAAAALALGLALLVSRTAFAQMGPPGAAVPAGPCGELQSADFSTVAGAPAAILATEIVSATETQPEYCAVTGLIGSQIQFVLWLPTGDWNGRYLQVGCGGYCGSLSPSDQCYDGLAQNYAVGFDNSGHLGGMMGASNALWAYNNDALRADFGYRSEHATATVAKAVIASFYGEEVGHAYYFGCSNGGRQALQLAQRWPEDFDGVIAGAPAAIQAPLNGIYEAWNGLANRDAEGSAILQQAQFQLLNEAVLASCDAADGLEDGQITDPRRCDFDPAALLCAEGEAPEAEAAPAEATAPLTGTDALAGSLPAGLSALPPLAGTEMVTGAAASALPPLAGADAMTGTAEAAAPAGMMGMMGQTAVVTATCLTAAQVEAAGKLYSGPVTADGVALYPGHEAPGSELGWPGWITGMAYGIGSGYLQYLAFPESDPSVDLGDWTFDVESFDSLRPLGEVYNATNPDLSAFAARGGKLILYHGWADPAIPPYGTLAYYQAVIDTAGGLEAAQEYARLYMVPGMFHCSGGDAPNTFDLLGPIQDWVENGAAPEQIIATQYGGGSASGGFADPTAGGSDAGEVVRTRPLCPFPLQQTYDGSGDIDDAASFSCALPAEAELAEGYYEWAGNDLFAPSSDLGAPGAD